MAKYQAGDRVVFDQDEPGKVRMVNGSYERHGLTWYTFDGYEGFACTADRLKPE